MTVGGTGGGGGGGKITSWETVFVVVVVVVSVVCETEIWSGGGVELFGCKDACCSNSVLDPLGPVALGPVCE